MLSKRKAQQLVDELGKIKGQIGQLQEQENWLREQLLKSGYGIYDGLWYRASVVRYVRMQRDQVFKTRVDKLIDKYLSKHFIAKHTIEKPINEVRVVARSTGTPVQQ